MHLPKYHGSELWDPRSPQKKARAGPPLAMALGAVAVSPSVFRCQCQQLVDLARTMQARAAQENFFWGRWVPLEGSSKGSFKGAFKGDTGPHKG